MLSKTWYDGGDPEISDEHWTEIVAASDLENRISINILRNFQGLISYSHTLPITRAMFPISEAMYILDLPENDLEIRKTYSSQLII